MANFQVQVEALTGLSLDGSSNPTLTQLNQFLQDGTRDVINRFVLLKPDEINKFSRTTNSTTSVAVIGKVISVMREHDSTSILRPCTLISPQDRYLATDKDSLSYRSKYNPGYYELNRSIHCVPAADSGNNDIVVTQVFYDTGVAYGDEVPEDFPEEYAYLVAIYAGIKSLENALAAKNIPTVAGDGTELTSVSQLSGDNTIDVLADQDEIDQWWATAGHLIEGEEDPELAISQVQKLTAYIQAYSAQLQGNQADYQWMLARHDYLQRQYDTIFQGIAPQAAQPQQQQQQQAQRRRR